MAAALSKGNYNLVCVAHPDDETLFFGGLLLRQAADRLPWVVVCVTFDGDQDRKRQFFEACRSLGVERPMWWEFPDKYEVRLNLEELRERLRTEFAETPHSVYTHGIVGEYGHPHHQDVSYAVHSVFRGHPRLFAVAYNVLPEFEIRLSAEEFAKKGQILTKVYSSETSRFLNVLPATFTEGFLRLDPDEIEAIYAYLRQGATGTEKLEESKLKSYRWLVDYLPYLRRLPRPF